jgi:hypothetical protein
MPYSLAHGLAGHRRQIVQLFYFYSNLIPCASGNSPL